MTFARMLAVVFAAANLPFVALNAYCFVALGHHWYSLPAIGLNIAAVCVCLRMAVRP